MTGRQQEGGMILLIACILALVLVSFGIFRPSEDRTILPGEPEPEAPAVQIRGDVPYRGVYRVSEDATAGDVLRQAAGSDIRLRPVSLRLDERLSDGDALLVTATGDGRVDVRLGRMEAGERLTLDIPLNLNTASEEELALLPGIGPKTAAGIVAERKRRGRFESLEALTSVRGIKEKRLQTIRAFLTVN